VFLLQLIHLRPRIASRPCRQTEDNELFLDYVSAVALTTFCPLWAGLALLILGFPESVFLLLFGLAATALEVYRPEVRLLQHLAPPDSVTGDVDTKP
jgi:hypothetical protein